MILDKQLMLSEAQAVTAAAGSDNTLDLGAVRNIGEGEVLFLVTVVTTAFTDSGSNSTLTVALEGDSTTSFTPDGTRDLFTIPALAAIGDTFFSKLSPDSAPLRYRYIRAKYTPNNGDLSAGAVTTFLTKDASKFRAYAKNYTIS